LNFTTKFGTKFATFREKLYEINCKPIFHHEVGASDFGRITALFYLVSSGYTIIPLLILRGTFGGVEGLINWRRDTQKKGGAFLFVQKMI
jgi:hypothetical protein